MLRKLGGACFSAWRDGLFVIVVQKPMAKPIDGVQDVATGCARGVRMNDGFRVLEPRLPAERNEGERVEREEEHREVQRALSEGSEHARIVPMALLAGEIPAVIEAEGGGR